LSVTEKEQQSHVSDRERTTKSCQWQRKNNKVLSVTEKEQQSLVSDRERTTKSCQWQRKNNKVLSVTEKEEIYEKGQMSIKVITKLPNSEQSYKGKVKTHNYINRQNQSTTGKLWKP
jgi:hypothetical protein